MEFDRYVVDFRNVGIHNCTSTEYWYDVESACGVFTGCCLLFWGGVRAVLVVLSCILYGIVASEAALILGNKFPLPSYPYS
jgi:hypothetical protein